MKNIAKSDPNCYTRWELSHKCNLNYNGSSPGMETAGTVKTLDGLCYASFYGDGDSKAYPAVQKIYGSNKPITKYECIGHYQKRVGCRLRRLKKVYQRLRG